jgi:hypothetical protein
MLIFMNRSLVLHGCGLLAVRGWGPGKTLLLWIAFL